MAMGQSSCTAITRTLVSSDCKVEPRNNHQKTHNQDDDINTFLLHNANRNESSIHENSTTTTSNDHNNDSNTNNIAWTAKESQFLSYMIGLEAKRHIQS